MSADCNICSNKCMGFENNHGGCCTVDERDFIIGPHTDTDRFIKDLSEKLGRPIKKDDVFINYNEGSALFPEKSTWQFPPNYPALRVDLNNPRRPCIFYNMYTKSCMVYEIRPKTCQEFECVYLKEQTEKLTKS